MSAYYDRWIDVHAQAIEAAVREHGRKGTDAATLAAWVIPSKPGVPGTLFIGTECPPGGTDVVRLGPHGSRLMHCPYSHIRPLLWNACRSFPILPMEG
jgi:hypothetical protein